MRVSKQPENTGGIICYYNERTFVLEQRFQARYDNNKQYLSVDRNSQELTLLKQFSSKGFEEKKFSAFLGIIDFDGQKFLLFCDQAKIVSTVDALEIFEISSLFFLGYTDQKILKKKPERKDIYRKIREYYILLKSGFYFSYKYNLTQPFRNQKNKIISQRFTWNKNFLIELEKYKINGNWKNPIIQGFVKSFEVFLEGTKLSYILISRRSNKKGGTRYFDRGLDEDGFVANFCQTEQIVKLDQFFISDLQIRGSIPIFFQQVGLTTRTKVNRGYELTHQIYKKHISKITKQYNRIFFANLLSVGKKGEKMLIEQLQQHIKKQVNPNLKYLYYDFHHKVKGGYYQKVDQIIEELRGMKINLRYHIYDSKKNVVLQQPFGVFRTNCLDCLDRTNFFQAKLALITLQAILKQFNICNKNLLQEMKSNDDDNDFIRKFRNIWADNGDAISFHYTGTGSTHTDITRDGKRGWLGNFKHKYKTVTRFYNQNFWDFYKMKLVGLLLGQKRQKDKLSKLIKQRENEYCKKQMHQIYIFTWKAPKKIPKSMILFPNTPKIIVINIQDMNDQQKWNKLISDSIDKQRYISVQQKKVYGNIIKVFALKQLKKDISFVQHGKIKFKSYYNTVLSNKCANFIRFSLHNTKLVFIGCQLEYGREFVSNRIRNLKQIHDNAFQIEEVGLQKSNTILSDDVIFLFGNMNSNISAAFKNQFAKFNPPSQVTQDKKKLIQKMLETDQFEQIRQNLLQYREYEQQQIKFLPTYKYSNGNFQPELSGWPDRIWYSSDCKINCTRYDVIQEMRNEHVPVIGTFIIEIQKINQELKENVYNDIIQKENLANYLGLNEEEDDEPEEAVLL